MEYYSIGKVAKLCHISIKTLRYYDEIGLLKPAFVNVENGYRYYTEKEIHKIALIKYYKELGFKLEHIKQLLTHYELNSLDRYFEGELHRIALEIEEAKRKYFAIEQWQQLLQLGKKMIKHPLFEVKEMPILPTVTFQYCSKELRDDAKEMVYSNAFVQFCQQHGYYTFGPFIIEHPNLQQRITGQFDEIYCYSAVYDYNRVQEAHRLQLGGIRVLSFIHKGSYAQIPEMYQEMQKWAKDNGYALSNTSYERFIIDGWSTQNVEQYVTELIIPLKEEK